MSTAFMEVSAGTLVAQRANLAPIFEGLGIAYHFDDDTPLQEVCLKKGLDPQMVAESLRSVDDTAPYADDTIEAHPLQRQGSFVDMVEHLIFWHHNYLRYQLPRLSGEIGKVARAYGKTHPELWRVDAEFDDVRAGIERHMDKEDLVLFPLCRRLDSDVAPREAQSGAVDCVVRVLEHEHQRIDHALETIRDLTHGYTPPADAKPDHVAVLKALAKLEADLHRHEQEEDDILFAKVLSREHIIEDQDLTNDLAP